ncbi:cell division protein FtsQ/DivIB [Selenihalanaerobacter shriftii]|uniref:Cell division protein FtsQ n=1 Tax=Selenihalanaerobacter shriftii TaxID=142842 RepID=A0A1T4K052_9FIRM|nr:FtsQ-type POTRA domain-containing protein [Selenihalanaerobacter shriftii]SJZ35665.1 cell division protein FtsQ [Selenihalanaerobacter shriftii]
MQRREYFLISLSLVFIISMLTFINSNFFDLAEIKVSGNKILNNKQVIKFTRLNKGQNIFQLDFDKISSRLMVKPQIEGVILKRHFPSMVRIVVDEREPLVAVLENDSYLLISKKGWIISKVQNSSDLNCPILEGVTIKKNNNKVKVDKKLKMVFQYLSKIDGEFIKLANKIKIKENGNLSLSSNSSIVKFGQPVRVEYKIKLFNQIYDDLNKKGKSFDYINLKYYNNPVIKLK